MKQQTAAKHQIIVREYCPGISQIEIPTEVCVLLDQKRLEKALSCGPLMPLFDQSCFVAYRPDRMKTTSDWYEEVYQ